MRSKLNGRDARRLSMAGRLTLVKSILLAILNYFMSTDRIPLMVYIEKFACNFLWGWYTTARKPALVNWNDCCKLVDLGVSESTVLLIKIRILFLRWASSC